MTREEAIKILNDEEIASLVRKFHGGKEALDLAIAALRPVGREQVERMRGEWIVKHDKYKEVTITECSKCGDETVYEFFFEEADDNFCPHCGAPMTAEAVQILIERMEELKNES